MEGYPRTLTQVRSVAAFSTLGSFLLSVEDGAQYDAVLLDINWDQSQNGMDVAEQLLVLSPHTQIIYVTGYSDWFAQQIFLQKSNLSGFLTKPIDPVLLQANLEKAAKANESAPPIVTILSQGKPISLMANEILYLESRGHTVHIYTTDEVIPVYQRLDDIAQLLPNSFAAVTGVYITAGCTVVFFAKTLAFKRFSLLYIPAFLFPLSLMGIVYASATPVGDWVFLVSLLLGCGALTALMYLLGSLEEKQALEIQLWETRHALELEQAHYLCVEQQRESLFHIRHDFKNQLASISALLQMGEE